MSEGHLVTHTEESTPQQQTPLAPQSVDALITRSAVFLVVVLNEGEQHTNTLRGVLSDLDGLVKTVGFHDPDAQVSCTVGIGHSIWSRLSDQAPPAELRPFQQITGKKHTAVATPGDVLFHIRSQRRDLCFEFERLLLEALGTSVTVVDEVSGFRYFDTRDLLGFSDGTANPVGPDLPASTLIGDEDPTYAGGSYVVVQKYTHSLPAWNALSAEEQEAIIGRRKMDGVELPDAVKGQKSHKTLTTIVDAEGEHDILRDNMPFGQPGRGEFGTYFIGYSRHLWVIERMLKRMFLGDPPGLHDRLLEFSTAETGGTFFVPTAAFLAALE